jgi:hypothetical protein
VQKTGSGRFAAARQLGPKSPGRRIAQLVWRGSADALTTRSDLWSGLALVVGWVAGTAVLARLSGLLGWIVLGVVTGTVVIVRRGRGSKTGG